MNSIEDVERLFLHKINPGIYLLKSNAIANFAEGSSGSNTKTTSKKL